MNKTRTTMFATLAALAAIVMVIATTTQLVAADPSHGTNGQCRQLQKTFPPDLQDFQGCHDTFTGKGHNNPPPLPGPPPVE